MREKYCFRLEIYDRLRASEQAEECTPDATAAARQHILETPREHVPKDSCVKAVITNSKYKHISFYLVFVRMCCGDIQVAGPINQRRKLRTKEYASLRARLGG